MEAERGPARSCHPGPQAAHTGGPGDKHVHRPADWIVLSQLALEGKRGALGTTGNCPGADQGGLIPSKWDPYPTPSHPYPTAKVQNRGRGGVLVPPA